jgi:hypothetical protein
MHICMLYASQEITVSLCIQSKIHRLLVNGIRGINDTHAYQFVRLDVLVKANALRVLKKKHGHGDVYFVPEHL